MKNCLFTLEKGLADGERPLIVKEAFQIFECSWDDSLENTGKDRAGSLDGYELPCFRAKCFAPYSNCCGILKALRIFARRCGWASLAYSPTRNLGAYSLCFPYYVAGLV